jgi:site-specific recombinase XerD
MLTRIARYFGLKKQLPQPSYLFVDVLREYIDKYKAENDLTTETANRYDVYYRNSSLFLAMDKLMPLQLSEIREFHAEQFRTWLRIHLKTCTIRHASRHVELWKRVTKYAVQMEYCINDRLSPIKPQRDKPKKIIALELNEVKKLIAYRFTSDIMRVVTDLFLFQCFSGLSYSDIYKFKIYEKNGKLWMDGERQKTGSEYMAFLFDDAKDILRKYGGKLPQLSNQKYNEYLKEIANLLNIRKKLTTHVGRKTNATLLAEFGMTAKSISLMLGHTVRVCDETYINNTRTIIENEMQRVGIGSRLIVN